MLDEKVAIFVDTENLVGWIKSDGPERLLNEIGSFGQAIVRRAYGKWTSHHLIPHQGELNRLGFELIHNYHPVSGKNSSDIQMTVDIMEYAWRVKEIHWFVLATGDSDFSPLFRRLRELGKEVVGVGPRSALSESVKSSCSRFIYTEVTNLNDKEALQSAFDDAADLVESVLRTFDGPANLAALKDKMRNVDSAFDEKSIGFSSFTAFLKAIDNISVTFDAEKTTSFASFISDESSSVTSDTQVDTSTHPKEDSPTPTIEEKPALEDGYRRILRKKGWKTLPKQDLVAIFKIMKTIPPLSRNEIIYQMIEQAEGNLTATDIRKALSLFFKGKVIDISTNETEDEKLWQLKDFVTEEEMLVALDEAMLDRLLLHCIVQGIEVNVEAIHPLLIGNYPLARIQNRVEQISKMEDEGIELVTDAELEL